MIRKQATHVDSSVVTEIMHSCLWLCIISYMFSVFQVCKCVEYDEIEPLSFKMNPAPDGHRCGVCPTYFQKICAFDFDTNATFIFDNHCVMDLHNCIKGTGFVPMNYDKCIYFGNFGYVHGYKKEDLDYGEDHIIVKNSKKHPDFITYK